MTHLEIEVHDDDWTEWAWLPDDAWQEVGSTIGVNWIRIRITDPRWIMFATLKYPEIDWLHTA